MEEWLTPFFGTNLWFVPASFLISYRCILRNVPGVIPAVFRNIWIKWLVSLYPTSLAMT